MIVRSALNAVGIAVFHNFYCILDQIKTDMSHNTGISHVSDIHLCDFQITIFILFQIKR